MIVGFKGESAKLKNLYKELGLKEVKPSNFEELEKAIAEIDGKTVISNYNEIVVFENPTADLVEKRTKILKSIENCKQNIYLAFTKNDPSIDILQLDLAVCTSLNTKDMNLIEEVFSFLNTDLPYSGKLSDDKYAVRVHGEERASERSLAELKKLLK